MRTNPTVVAAGLIAGLSPAGAVAEGYYTPAPLLGEHANSLGGAFTAVADDPTAAYYNPAGLAALSTSIFGANLDLYELSFYDRKNALQVPGVEADVDTHLLSAVPSSFGVAWALRGGQGLAVSVLVPETEHLSGGATAEGPTGVQGALELERTDRTWLVGPSYALRLGDTLSVGASLYYELRLRHTTTRQRDGQAAPSQGATQLSRLSLDLTDERASHGALTGVLGVLATLGRVRLGLSVYPPGLPLHDHCALYHARGLGAGAEAPSGLYLRQTFDLGFTVRSPLRATLGAALTLGDLLLSADLRGQAGGDAFDTVSPPADSGLAPRRIDPKPMLNGSLGAEYHVTDTYTVRAGAYTRLAGITAPDGRDPAAPEVEDQVGAVLGVTRRAGATTLTLSAGYTLGFGAAPGVRVETGPDGRPREVGVALDTRTQAIRISTRGSYAF